jgi:hypothetical protein
MTTPTKEQPVSGAKELVERLARSLYASHVSLHGFPNGLPTWDEMPERIERRIDLYTREHWRGIASDHVGFVEAATLLERQEQAAGKLQLALIQTQLMLETIVRTHSTNFSEVHERIIANRPALREHHEAHNGN